MAYDEFDVVYTLRGLLNEANKKTQEWANAYYDMQANRNAIANAYEEAKQLLDAETDAVHALKTSLTAMLRIMRENPDWPWLERCVDGENTIWAHLVYDSMVRKLSREENLNVVWKNKTVWDLKVWDVIKDRIPQEFENLIFMPNGMTGHYGGYGLYPRHREEAKKAELEANAYKALVRILTGHLALPINDSPPGTTRKWSDFIFCTMFRKAGHDSKDHLVKNFMKVEGNRGLLSDDDWNAASKEVPKRIDRYITAPRHLSDMWKDRKIVEEGVENIASVDDAWAAIFSDAREEVFELLEKNRNLPWFDEAFSNAKGDSYSWFDVVSSSYFVKTAIHFSECPGTRWLKSSSVYRTWLQEGLADMPWDALLENIPEGMEDFIKSPKQVVSEFEAMVEDNAISITAGRITPANGSAVLGCLSLLAEELRGRRVTKVIFDREGVSIELDASKINRTALTAEDADILKHMELLAVSVYGESGLIEEYAVETHVLESDLDIS